MPDPAVRADPRATVEPLVGHKVRLVLTTRSKREGVLLGCGPGGLSITSGIGGRMLFDYGQIDDIEDLGQAGEGPMSEQRMIYVLEYGEYSDYGVSVAFEREEDAQDAVQAGAGDDYREMKLFPPGHRLAKRVVHRASVRLFGDGTVDQMAVWSTDTWDYDDDPALTRLVDRTAGAPWKGSSWTTICYEGPDREQVVKAASDRLAKLRAEREGL